MGTYTASRAVAASMEPLTDVEMWLLGGDLSYSAGWDGQSPNQVADPALLSVLRALILTGCQRRLLEYY